MLGGPAAALAALRESGTVTSRLVLDTGRERFDVDAAWEVRVDRGAMARRTITARIDPTLDTDYLLPFGTLLRPYRGVVLDDGSMWEWPVGVLRISRPHRGYLGAWEVTGYSLERYVNRVGFRRPYVPVGSVQACIRDLITTAHPGAEVDTSRAGMDVQVPPGLMFTGDRWEAIAGTDKSLARSIGCDVFADAAGVYRVVHTPTIADPVAWTADAKDVLLDHAEEYDDEHTYSVVVATGQQVGSDQPIPWGEAVDDNPYSRTWVGGPFGVQTRHHSSPLYASDAQCAAGARSLLADSLGVGSQLQLNTLQNPALEGGDVLEVLFTGGRRRELHVADSFAVSSDPEASMTIGTRATQVEP